MDWYLLAFKRYAEFSGRSTRKEFWYFQLFNFLVAMALAFMLMIWNQNEIVILVNTLILLAYTLAVFIPSIAVTVRRLHDTGRSGWWYFISWIPLIGGIILLVFLIERGDAGANEYGPAPASVPYGAV